MSIIEDHNKVTKWLHRKSYVCTPSRNTASPLCRAAATGRSFRCRTPYKALSPSSLFDPAFRKVRNTWNDHQRQNASLYTSASCKRTR